ncbi:hypothetical protein HanRHA438_Chr16g0773041 [Helianthus annuus]|nr:hypothetical protein HanRHA438_Chr16g0773041 [Helianthus annuus]
MEKAGEDRLDRIQVTLTEISESLKQLVEILKTNLEEEGLQEEDQTGKKRKCVDGSSMAAVHVAKDEAAIVNKRQSSFFKKGRTGLEFAYTYVLEDFKKASGGTFSFEDVLLFDAIERPEPPPIELKGVLERYASFKRFDTVSDHSDHYFSAYTWTHVSVCWGCLFTS